MTQSIHYTQMDR